MQLLNEVSINTVRSKLNTQNQNHEYFSSQDTNYGVRKLYNHDTSSLDHFTNKPNHNVSELGRGVEAIVYSKSSDSGIGTVSKWIRKSKFDIENNSVIQFLIRSNEANNIFAPKVYKITKITHPDAAADDDDVDEFWKNLRPKYDKHYIIKMEKLQKLRELSSVELFALMRTMSETGDFDGAEDITVHPADVALSINRLVNRGRGTRVEVDGKISFDANEQLIEIIQLVRDVTKDTPGCRSDIHMDNVMVRRTSVGPQLVFTDPVYQD